MSRSTLEEAKRAWSQGSEGLSEEEVGRQALGFGAIVRGIAERGAVSPDEFAKELGLEPAAARELFEGFARAGVELDEAGNISGAALTTTKTPHEVQMSGRTFYAWCALDTLFIPGLVGEPAEVISRCPVSGAEIRLSVSPQGVVEHSPREAALSVFLPGASSLLTGPASPT